MELSRPVFRFVACLVCGIAGLTTARPPTHASSINTSWMQGWPMFRHDPQRTSRSPEVGPKTPHLLFRMAGMHSQPLLGPDGSVYGWGTGGLLALGLSGERRWLYPSSEGDAGGPPVLSSTGVVYADGYLAGIPFYSPLYSRIFALTASGRLAWMIHANEFAKGAAPYATASGNFYAPFVGPESGKLEVVSSKGRELRHIFGGSFGSVAQSPNGTIYAYLQGRGLLALSLKGVIRWGHGMGRPDMPNLPIVVGKQGRVYAATATGVSAFTPRGRLLWRETETGPAQGLAEAATGALLVVGTHWLTQLDTRGQPVWRVAVGSSDSAPPALAVDAAGKSYVVAGDGSLHIVSDSGVEIFHQSVCQTQQILGPTVALGVNGRLAIECDTGLQVFG